MVQTMYHYPTPDIRRRLHHVVKPDPFFAPNCSYLPEYDLSLLDLFLNMPPPKNEDIITEIEELVQVYRSNSTPPADDPLCVHARPHDDGHYPFTELRKKRTKMRCGVCVWCAVKKLMTYPERPKLQYRPSSNEANWEKWLRELDSPRRGFLTHLVTHLLPKREVLRFIPHGEIHLFYRDVAGALIELELRELRENEMDERSLMAQVRSSKYHKTVRVAGIIEGAYG